MNNYRLVFSLPIEQNIEQLQETLDFCCDDTRTDFIVRAVSLCPDMGFTLKNGEDTLSESDENVQDIIALVEHKIAEGETHLVESTCYDSEVWEQYDRKLMAYVIRCTPREFTKRFWVPALPAGISLFESYSGRRW